MSILEEADTNSGGGWITETKRQTQIVVVAGSQRHSDSCFIRQDGGGRGWGGDGRGTTHTRALKPHAASVLPLSLL